MGDMTHCPSRKLNGRGRRKGNILARSLPAGYRHNAKDQVWKRVRFEECYRAGPSSLGANWECRQYQERGTSLGDPVRSACEQKYGAASVEEKVAAVRRMAGLALLGGEHAAN